MNIVDLRGPGGNAFVLLGMARSLGKQKGMTEQEINDLIDKMMSEDYEALVELFTETFEGLIQVVR